MICSNEKSLVDDAEALFPALRELVMSARSDSWALQQVEDFLGRHDPVWRAENPRSAAWLDAHKPTL